MKKTLSVLSILAGIFISIVSYAQESTLPNAIENLLQWEEAFGFSGSVLIEKDEKIILSKGYGFANKEKGIKNTPQTIYYIASVSKPITALAIMKLVEQKHVRLDDPITTYFVNVPKTRQGITIEHLLTHTSGLDHTYSCDDITNREKAIEIILNETPQLDPVGTAYHYSGDNYTLLAAIIEIASQDTFENYVGKNVLSLAGIFTSGESVPAFVGQIKNLTSEQIASPIEISRYTTIKDIESSWGRKGRAGMILSVEDLYKLDAAFVSNKIVHAATVASILSSSNTNPSTAYGYGYTLGVTTRDTKVFGHSGDDDGIGHNVEYLDFPDDRIKIFIASNSGLYSGTSWSAIISSLLQRILLPSNYNYSNSEDPNGQFYNYTLDDAEKLVGVYSNSEGSGYHVWINNSGQLVISPVGETVTHLIGFPKAYSDKNQLTRTLLEEATRNEFVLLKNLSKGDESFENLKSIISGQLESIVKKNGLIEKINVLGTANIWSGNYQAEIATWFQLVSKDGTVLFRMEWDNQGKIAGLGGGRIRYPLMFQLRATAKNKFIGFDAANGKSIEVNFLTVDTNGKSMLEVTMAEGKPLLLANTGNLHLLPKRSAGELLYRVITTQGSQAAVNEVKNIMNNPDQFDVNEGDLNDFGYKLLNDGRVEESIALFTIITKWFPESSNGFDSLGEAYLKAGNKTEALRCYKKSLDLDPNNKAAKRIIDSLR